MNMTVAFSTIMLKEVVRIVRIWTQTLLPPAITLSLYFVIFGNLIGPRIGRLGDFHYIDFIVPGLIMMSVITNSYGNVVSSFFGAKFQKSIEEILVSPTPDAVMILGYVCGGVFRGLLVGGIVTCVSLLFTSIKVYNISVIFSVIVLSAVLFSLGGYTNAIFARKFDDISIIPAFVLTPLTYLGGVFYSIDMLPPIWKTVSLFNPILYMVNAFRYGFLGVSDVDMKFAFFIIILSIFLLFGLNLHLTRRGVGLRG